MVALDAKVTIDDNALYRHPDTAALRNPSAEDPQEQMAKERGLTYVKLDGNIGILGNGAGLVMSTLDVVAQAGGRPANFLDAGGGSKAEAIVDAVEVILSNEKVTAVLFNIFGGITRCDEVANGLVTAFAPDRARRCRSWSGSTAPTTRRAAGYSPRPTSPTCTSRRRCSRPPTVVELAGDEHPRRRQHPALRVRHHRPRGQLPRPQQPLLRHRRRVAA